MKCSYSRIKNTLLGFVHMPLVNCLGVDCVSNLMAFM